ncbi:NAD(P)-dependent oxidoreductase [Mucilaginibacter sp. CSA2-8R]|uniref:NAD(P)-dependent oxidoreductase n=1 Tax=Mucilaginibacter sp. CSA2-8R TaxID=3141542 RepID=UPI00315D0C1A
MSTVKIGWAGLGNMGIPMAGNLIKAGYPVQVFNRTREKEKPLLDAGAESAGGLSALAANNDIIFVMVSDDDAAKKTFSAGDGLLADDVSGKLFINVSTVASETSKYLYEQCRQKGAKFLETPVSGSVKPAQDATLIILVGGETDAFEQAKPVLDKLGKLTLHLGPVGVGSAAKLAINYLLGLNLQGLAETVLFAKAGGVKTEDMLTIINEGAIGNGITKLKSPAILKGEFPAAFALKHLAKDLRLARAQGLDAPLSEPLYSSFKQAQDDGLGDQDVMAIYKHLDQ